MFAAVVLIGAGCKTAQPTPQVDSTQDPTQYFVMMRPTQNGKDARGEAHVITSDTQFKLIGQFSLPDDNYAGVLVCGDERRPIGALSLTNDLFEQRFSAGSDFVDCSDYEILDSEGTTILTGAIDREVGYFGDEYWQ